MSIAIALAAGFTAAAGPAARGEDSPPAVLHVALSAGVGLAYDLAGIRLEVRGERFGLYAGTGFLGFNGGTGGADASSLGGCAGMYFFPVRAGEGPLLSLNGTLARFSVHYVHTDANTQLLHGSIFTLTATIGYRWRWDHFFLGAALGGGILRDSDPPGAEEGFSPPPGVGNHLSTTLIPDLELGLGFEL